MRYRPLCLVFCTLSIAIFILYSFGVPLPGTLSFSEDDIKEIEETEHAEVTGTVSERIKGEKGYSYFISDSFLISGGSKIPLHTVRINTTDEFIVTGTAIKAYGSLSFYRNASNPGGFNSALYYMAEDVYCSLKMTSYQKASAPPDFNPAEWAVTLRDTLSENFTEAAGEECGGILSAMILGDKSSLTDEVKNNYSVSGLSHLLAISGLHIGVIGAAVLSLFLLIGIPKIFSSLMASVVLFSYCMFTGAGESTLRAFIMFEVMCISSCILRTYDMINSISIAGIVLLLLRPMLLFRTGFQLSFLAVLALAVLFPLFRRRFIKPHSSVERKKLSIKLRMAAEEGFFVWLSVNLVTFPVVLYNYCEIPVYGAIANILFVPMTELILLTGILGGVVSLLFFEPAKVILMIPKALITIQNSCGEFLKSLPFSRYICGQPDLVKIILYYAGLLLLIIILKKSTAQTKEILPARVREYRQKRKSRRVIVTVMIAILLIGFIFIRPFRSFSIAALDVGQGDCAVITTDSGSVFMIDGGSSSSSNIGYYTILPYLKSRGYSYVNAVFLSHGDKDHINGIEEILALSASHDTAVKIGKVIMPLWMKKDETGQRIEEDALAAGTEVLYASKGDKVTAGSTEFLLINPAIDDGFTDNEGSMVISLTYGEFKALFTGDIEGEAEEKLAETIGEYDYLKVAHHGSKGTSSQEFLNAVSAKFALISAPEKSVYGHPSEETLERLKIAGIPWLQTGLKGAVTTTYENGIMKVTSYK